MRVVDLKGKTMKKTEISMLGLCAGLALTLAPLPAGADGYVQGLKDPRVSWTGRYFGAYFGAGAGSADSSFRDTQTQRFVQTVPGHPGLHRHGLWLSER